METYVMLWHKIIKKTCFIVITVVFLLNMTEIQHMQSPNLIHQCNKDHTEVCCSIGVHVFSCGEWNVILVSAAHSDLSAVLQPTPHPNPNTHTLSHLQPFSSHSLTHFLSLFGRTFHHKIGRMKMLQRKKGWVWEKDLRKSVQHHAQLLQSLSPRSLCFFPGRTPLLHLNTTPVVNFSRKRKKKLCRELPDISRVGGQAHTRATGHQADTTNGPENSTVYEEKKSIISVHRSD